MNRSVIAPYAAVCSSLSSPLKRSGSRIDSSGKWVRTTTPIVKKIAAVSHLTLNNLVNFTLSISEKIDCRPLVAHIHSCTASLGFSLLIDILTILTIHPGALCERIEAADGPGFIFTFRNGLCP